MPTKQPKYKYVISEITQHREYPEINALYLRVFDDGDEAVAYAAANAATATKPLQVLASHVDSAPKVITVETILRMAIYKHRNANI